MSLQSNNSKQYSKRLRQGPIISAAVLGVFNCHVSHTLYRSENPECAAQMVVGFSARYYATTACDSDHRDDLAGGFSGDEGEEALAG